MCNGMNCNYENLMGECRAKLRVGFYPADAACMEREDDGYEPEPDVVEYDHDEAQ